MKKDLTVFSVLLMSAFMVYCFKYIGLYLPFLIRNYYNDLVALPIVLFICRYIIYFLKGRFVKISLLVCFALACFYSVYFEYYLPMINSRYTADLWDVLIYFVGAFCFWLYQNKLRS